MDDGRVLQKCWKIEDFRVIANVRIWSDKWCKIVKSVWICRYPERKIGSESKMRTLSDFVGRVISVFINEIVSKKQILSTIFYDQVGHIL